MIYDREPPLKVLIACEFSGIVRDAFRMEGFDATSCDLLPSPTGSNHHIQGDVRDILDWGWDLMMVAHPPCTRLCNSGVRWLSKAPPNRTLDEMWQELDEGADLFSTLWNAPVPHVALENPVMHKYAKERITNFENFAQSFQPWEFVPVADNDHPDNQKKRTCLWLRNLPKLEAPRVLDGSTAKDLVHKAAPGPDRWKLRSTFFPSVAQAMARQWGTYAQNLKNQKAVA